MSKTTKEQCKCISIYDFQKRGVFEQECNSGSFEWTNRIKSGNDIAHYTFYKEDMCLYFYHKFISHNHKEMRYEISLTTTPCNYGKERYWFICPNKKCLKRVAKLYLSNNNSYFMCRHCLNLSYDSRNINKRSSIAFFLIIDALFEQFQKLNSNIKIPYRAGKATKKWNRLLKIYYVLQSWGEKLKKEDRKK